MGIPPSEFYDVLVKNEIDFFAGVPDSLLKEFGFCLEEKVSKKKHIIAANEGNAIALAAGYYLATGKIPLVYMQNSGFGNAVNPLLSLCDPDVYSIPILIVIGWRGEPGISDEAQHIKQGKVQIELLKAMSIPYEIISADGAGFRQQIAKAVQVASSNKTPFAIVIKKGTFDVYGKTVAANCNLPITREECLKVVLSHLPENSVIVSTTGKTSREIFEIREKNKQVHSNDFLTIGSMGHCSSIALGIAIGKPNKKVFCIDGDGAFIMHMGFLATAGKLSLENFYHLLINNGVYDSTGGQETSAGALDVLNLVKASGYKHIYSVSERNQLVSELDMFTKSEGPNFFEIKVRPGSREGLGRPKNKPKDDKEAFMKVFK